jgi:hypothetical protein
MQASLFDDDSLACPAGYYCPGLASIHECQVGYMCPVGSERMYPCTFPNSACPEKRMSEPNTGQLFAGLVLCLAVVLLVGKMFSSFTVWNRKRKFRNLTEYKMRQLQQQRSSRAIAATESQITVNPLEIDQLELDQLIEKSR